MKKGNSRTVARLLTPWEEGRDGRFLAELHQAQVEHISIPHGREGGRLGTIWRQMANLSRWRQCRCSSWD